MPPDGRRPLAVIHEPFPAGPCTIPLATATEKETRSLRTVSVSRFTDTEAFPGKRRCLCLCLHGNGYQPTATNQPGDVGECAINIKTETRGENLWGN